MRNAYDPSGYLTGVKQLVSGNGFIMALTVDNVVWGWGENSGAQLGQGHLSDITAVVPSNMV